jgi:hypothetical protein
MVVIMKAGPNDESLASLSTSEVVLEPLSSQLSSSSSSSSSTLSTSSFSLALTLPNHLNQAGALLPTHITGFEESSHFVRYFHIYFPLLSLLFTTILFRRIFLPLVSAPEPETSSAVNMFSSRTTVFKGNSKGKQKAVPEEGHQAKTLRLFEEVYEKIFERGHRYAGYTNRAWDEFLKSNEFKDYFVSPLNELRPIVTSDNRREWLYREPGERIKPRYLAEFRKYCVKRSEQDEIEFHRLKKSRVNQCDAPGPGVPGQFTVSLTFVFNY